jgi:hypothetical protein
LFEASGAATDDESFAAAPNCNGAHANGTTGSSGGSSRSQGAHTNGSAAADAAVGGSKAQARHSPTNLAAGGGSINGNGSGEGSSAAGMEAAVASSDGAECVEGVAISKDIALMSPYVLREVVQNGFGLDGNPPVMLPKQVGCCFPRALAWPCACCCWRSHPWLRLPPAHPAVCPLETKINEMSRCCCRCLLHRGSLYRSTALSIRCLGARTRQGLVARVACVCAGRCCRSLRVVKLSSPAWYCVCADMHGCLCDRSLCRAALVAVPCHLTALSFAVLHRLHCVDCSLRPSL